MRVALPSESNSSKLPIPNGLVSVKIDPVTGYRANPGDPDAIFEMFREEQVPPPAPALARKEDGTVPEKQIF
jgi:penicillin-binding protein 1A